MHGLATDGTLTCWCGDPWPCAGWVARTDSDPPGRPAVAVVPAARRRPRSLVDQVQAALERRG